ncbi:WYL domain-containing protein [Ornithobacterium rhinotracheale]|uniref:helix-turn-helix transcriptional regulator n=1 Tax=Ornithobacterium rhinotracheale TaxID=28251 RepID=UPI00129CC775|nr:WYL domain-containing protein [Ornithobacterium rhinotracheale]MRI62643.1 WYL domain-containing protein [Ornithobacterium rhinotracheale]
MAKNTLNQYIWLVDTIYSAKKISFEKLNEKWKNSSLSEGEDLPIRTFHRWKNKVQELFNLNIECETKNGYKYYLEGEEEIAKKGIKNWLLETISVGNLLLDNESIKNRILIDERPNGMSLLPEIINAIKENHPISIVYQKFSDCDSKRYVLNPYGIKFFKNRWYLIGVFSRDPERLLIFALDRIKNIETQREKTFEYDKNQNLSDFFEDYYGVILSNGESKEKVVLKIVAEQVPYLRSLPLHHSQKEIEQNSEFSLFQLEICPTYDFMQEILSLGDKAEIISPEWLRNHIKAKVINMFNAYNK